MARSQRNITLGKGTPAPVQPAQPAQPTVMEPNSPAVPSLHEEVTQMEHTPAINDPANVAQEMPNLPPNLANNEIARKKAWYLQKARELGKVNVKGKLSLIALAESCVDGGVEDALKITDAKDGDSDAIDMFARFNHPIGKPIPATDQESSFRTNARKLKWFIKLGNHYGAAGKKFFSDVHELHLRCYGDKSVRESLKYAATYEAVLNVIRNQMMKAETKPDAPLMNEDEQFQVMLKGEKTDLDAIDYLIDAFKALMAADEGRQENSKKGIAARTGLHSPEVKDLMERIRDFVADLGDDEKTRFFEGTSPKKKGKKAATTETTDTTETRPTADEIESLYGEGEGEGIEGEEQMVE